jgi:hypothetical protein
VNAVDGMKLRDFQEGSLEFFLSLVNLVEEEDAGLIAIDKGLQIGGELETGVELGFGGGTKELGIAGEVSAFQDREVDVNLLASCSTDSLLGDLSLAETAETEYGDIGAQGDTSREMLLELVGLDLDHIEVGDGGLIGLASHFLSVPFFR